MPRSISDRRLRRWLETGRPARVGRRVLADPALQDRLEGLTRLDDHQRERLERIVSPRPGFDERTVEGMRSRIDDHDTLAALGEVLGLGFRVGRLFLAPGEPPDEPTS